MPYRGIVWCPRTDDGTWLARRKGTTFWTGNTYPGSALLTKGLIGTPIPLEGRVAGLSMMTEVLPGFGPAVQVPTAFFLPHNPDWDSVREVVFPFGQPQGLSDIKSFAPAWLQKVAAGASDEFRSPENQEAFDRTVMHIFSQRIGTGEVKQPTSDVERRGQLTEAAERATKFWLVRGFLQAGAPSSPSPEFMVKDTDGTLIAAGIMRKQFQELADKVGYTKATTDFLNEHGEQAYFSLASMSNALVYGAPVTKDGRDWVRANPSLRGEFPNVYGLFAPVGGEFDYDAYVAQFGEGDREAITPEQYVAMAMNRLGRNVYERFAARLGPNPSTEGRQRLRLLQTVLQSKYPGYSPYFGGGVAGLGSKVPPEVAVQELRKAAIDPRLKDRPQAVALQKFLKAWDAANEKARGAGLADATSAKAAQPLREVLRAHSADLAERYAGWGPVFDYVFSPLMADDLPEVELAVAA